MKFESLAPPPLQFGPVFVFAWGLFRTLIWPVAIIAALLLPWEIARTALEAAIKMNVGMGWGFALGALLGLVTSSLSSAVFLSTGAAALKGEGFRTSSVRRGLGLWTQVFCAQLLCGLLFLCGFVLLVVPGLYILLRLIVTDLIVVVDRVSAPTAIKRSLSLTKGREGDLLVVLGTLVAIWAGVLLLLYLLGVALQILNSLPVMIVAIYLALVIGALFQFIVIGIYQALIRGSEAE